MARRSPEYNNIAGTSSTGSVYRHDWLVLSRSIGKPSTEITAASALAITGRPVVELTTALLGSPVGWDRGWGEPSGMGGHVVSSLKKKLTIYDL